MAIFTNSETASAQNDVFMAHFGNKINAGTADPISIRKQHYQKFTPEDMHYLYEICTSIIDTLSTNGITVELGRSENRQINHRKAVKARFPKDYKGATNYDANQYSNPTPQAPPADAEQNLDTTSKKGSTPNPNLNFD